MRFLISSTNLSNRLIALSKVLNSRVTMPILNCFLFETKQEQLVITASDGENVMRSTLNLDQCEGEGRFAVNSRNILDAVRELPEQPLSIEVNLTEHMICISYQNGKYNFPVMAADEFPQTQKIDESANTFTIDAVRLNDYITRSIFATAQDDLRPVMNGLFFDMKEDGLRIVATDGQKLVRNIDTTIKSVQPSAFILPKKPAALLKGALTKESGEVVIRFDQRCAEISFADGYIYCRLIEGKYPNYSSVIPSNNPNQIVVDRRSLMGALKRVLPFASESVQLIRFHIDAGVLSLNAEDLDFATNAKESITCDYTGTSMSIGFKGSSMLEILGNLTSEEVCIQLADPSRPGVVVPAEQAEDINVLMLIVPMLLND